MAVCVRGELSRSHAGVVVTAFAVHSGSRDTVVEMVGGTMSLAMVGRVVVMVVVKIVAWSWRWDRSGDGGGQRRRRRRRRGGGYHFVIRVLW